MYILIRDGDRTYTREIRSAGLVWRRSSEGILDAKVIMRADVITRM
jgi:hypothetical protein